MPAQDHISHDSVAIVDQDGVIRAVNAAWHEFARTNGYSGDPFIGQNYFEHCPPSFKTADGRPLQEAIKQAISEDAGFENHEYDCSSPREARTCRLEIIPLLKEATMKRFMLRHKWTQTTGAMVH